MMQKAFVENIPIPRATAAEQASIAALAGRILALKGGVDFNAETQRRGDSQSGENSLRSSAPLRLCVEKTSRTSREENPANPVNPV